MQIIYIRGGDKEGSGVIALTHHLKNLGHKIVRSKEHDYDAVVCWGVSTRDPLIKRVPALNGNVNLFNKYEALMRFKRAGVPIPETVASNEIDEDSFPPHLGPWFGRKFHHQRGKDITLYDTWRDVVNNGTKDFYTQYFEHSDELRYWVFKDKVFAVYQKHYRNFGLNNYKTLEYRSENRDDLLRNALDIHKTAIQAVKALKMDFGAVDVLYNANAKRHVALEVNSMPDISSLERVSGVRLARIISDWTHVN